MPHGSLTLVDHEDRKVIQLEVDDPQDGEDVRVRLFEADATVGEETEDDRATKKKTGIVGGIERLAGGALVYSGPDNPKLRAGMALHVSKAAGASWPASGAKMLWPGPAGYSDMIALPGRESVAVIFECGTKSFADQVSVAIVSKAWLQSSR